MRKRKALEAILNWMETNVVMQAFRRGLALTIPVLMVGCFASALLWLPIGPYNEFITTFFGGKIAQVLTWIVSSTNNILALVLIVCISYAYASEVDKKRIIMYPVCSLCSYLAFVHTSNSATDLGVFHITWLFTATVITLVSCGLLHFLFKKCGKLIQKLYAEGADSFYQLAVSAIIPVFLIVVLFALINMGVQMLGGQTNFQNIGTIVCDGIFKLVGNSMAGALLFVLLLNLFWFFGLHGGNILVPVTYAYFVPGMILNAELIAGGNAPTQMFTTSFFDHFVMLGGCGATLCLLFAIFIAAKKTNNRRIAKISIFPAILNINELVIWGFPVILNPIMLVPFVFAPVVIMLFTTLVMHLGLVPIAATNVVWTAPIIFSGVKATGSIAGGILQIINIVIGTAIYIPFVRISERRQTKIMKESISLLQNKVMEGEAAGAPVYLLECDGRLSSIAKMLIEDLHYAMKQHCVELHYQPQIRNDGTILGAEALLRWKHPVMDDYIYPPLIIQLAKEDGYLDYLGLWIIEDAAQTLEQLSTKTREPLKISVNISPCQLESATFCDDVLKILNKYDFGTGKLAIEITEQVSLSTSPIIAKRIDRLRAAGIQFIMDDFGMGHSSMMYLKNNDFAYVKLDGSMVKELLENNRISDIIISIKKLSESLNFEIIAEYVEMQEQRDKLEELGCNIYQGWLYSKAIKKDDFEDFLQEYNAIEQEKNI